MEVSAFQEHIGSSFSSTRIQTSEYTGNTHRFFRVANHQVLVGQFAFHFVQCNKRSSLGTSLHHNLAALNLVSIEAVHRLTISVQNVIGNIDDVIDRTHTDKAKLVLQPFRTFLHRYSLDGHSGITRAGFGIFHHNVDVHVMIVYLESIYRRTLQRSFMTVLNEPCVKVTCHTVVGAGIGTVRSNVHFKHVFALHVIVILGQCTRNYVSRQYDDTFVACTHANFIFGTNHTV